MSLTAAWPSQEPLMKGDENWSTGITFHSVKAWNVHLLLAPPILGVYFETKKQQYALAETGTT